MENILALVFGPWRLHFPSVFNCKYLFVHFLVRYLPTSDVHTGEQDISKGFRFHFRLKTTFETKLHTHTANADPDSSVNAIANATF